LSLQTAVNGAQRQQLLDREKTFFRQAGIPHRAGMPLGQDKTIPVRAAWVLRINTQKMKVQGSHNVSAGERPARMAGLRTEDFLDYILAHSACKNTRFFPFV